MNPLRLTMLAATLPTLAACSSGPVTACTEIGCSDSTTVLLTAATGDLGLGDYRVLLESAGGELSECSFTISDDCDGGSHCVVDGDDCNASFVVDDGRGDTVTILHGLIEGVLALQVLIDDVVVHDADHDPEDVTFQPNGEGCEPICTSRELAAELDGG